MHIGDEAKAEGDRNQAGVDTRIRQRPHPAGKQRSGQGFADPAEGQGAERHTELDGRQKIVQILLKAAHGAGSGGAGGKHLLDAGVADRNQRELRSHKKAVGQNKHGHSDKLEKEKTVHLACEHSILPITSCPACSIGICPSRAPHHLSEPSGRSLRMDWQRIIAAV